jgi:hypothetical protein
MLVGIVGSVFPFRARFAEHLLRERKYIIRSTVPSKSVTGASKVAVVCQPSTFAGERSFARQIVRRNGIVIRINTDEAAVPEVMFPFVPADAFCEEAGLKFEAILDSLVERH